jgi:hypothetical protein
VGFLLLFIQWAPAEEHHFDTPGDADILRFALHAGDTIILGTDGCVAKRIELSSCLSNAELHIRLFDNVDEETLLITVSECSGNAQDVADELLDVVCARVL